jgi:N-acyl-D-aspartate/D-glutamate deacylase
VEAGVFDVIIRGGDVVDGTGRPRRRADVGVRDGRIAEIGDLPHEAVSVIDATGRVVTPGFVDVHTHYDAQLFWDAAMTPSPLHGVTTVLAGNCGFSIAPLSEDPADGDYLMRMLARVEGMPLESLRTGVPWSWTSTAQYFDAIDGRLGVNAGFMVGHSAIRRTVLGGEATGREATPDEVARMRRLLHEGLDAGATGFSSSWSRTHNDAEGRMVPSRWAGRDELVELCRATGGHDGTSLEFIPMAGAGAFEPWAIELMADMSVAARRPLNWNILPVTAARLDQARAQLADDLLTSFGRRSPADSADDWKARLEVWRDPRAVIGASDAGAHLDMLASFNYPTILLAEAVRKHQVLSLEEAVQLLADVPARLYGLVERGRIERGWHADLVVLDPGCVGTEEVAMRFDLPGGAGRLFAGSQGIEHVLVNGRPIVTDGAVTTERAGTLLRSGHDTRTPDLG